jgi:hypothetical protein
MPRKSTKLSIREKVFVSAIASDPTKPTFANGVRSALSVSGDVNAPHGSPAYAAANRIAVDLLKKDSVQAAIDKTLTAHKLTVADRAAALSDILHTSEHITTHTTKDKDGNISSVQEIIHSNAADRIKAIDLVNKMDGTYSRASNESQLHTKVLSTMLEEYSRKMRVALQNASIRSVEGQGEEQTPIDVDIVGSVAEGSTGAVSESVEGEHRQPTDERSHEGV